MSFITLRYRILVIISAGTTEFSFVWAKRMSMKTLQKVTVGLNREKYCPPNLKVCFVIYTLKIGKVKSMSCYETICVYTSGIENECLNMFHYKYILCVI